MIADPKVAGTVVASCHIDLPQNDVVESIDFERFFFLNLSFGDVGGPATLPMGTHVNRLYNTVPFSGDQEDWTELKVHFYEKRGMAAAPRFS